MTFTLLFGRNARNRLLDFLGDHPMSDYTITEMAEKGDLTRAQIYAGLPELEATGLVLETRRIGQSRLFRINTENPVVQAVLSADLARHRDEIPA